VSVDFVQLDLDLLLVLPVTKSETTTTTTTTTIIITIKLIFRKGWPRQLSYELDDWVQILGGAMKGFFSHHCIQTSSVACSASYPVGTRGKVAEM
jgi:hypothetical protein